MKTYYNKTLNKKVTIPEPTIFVIREQINTDNPSDKGSELMRFETWEEARSYSDNLWIEDGIKAYVSEEVI